MKRASVFRNTVYVYFVSFYACVCVTYVIFTWFVLLLAPNPGDATATSML